METTSTTDTGKKIGAGSGDYGQTSGQTAESWRDSRRDSLRQEYGFASDVELKECKYCRVMIPKKARICPNCKMVLKNRWLLKTVAALLFVAVIGTGSYFLSAYWGLLDESRIPEWVRSIRPKTAVSTAVVGVEEVKTGVVVAEPAKAKEAGQAQTAKETKEAEELKDLSAAVKTGSENAVEDSGGKDDGKDLTTQENPDKADQDSEDGSGNRNKEAGQEEQLKETQAEQNKDQNTSGEADENEEAYRTECEPVGYKALLRKQEEYLDTPVTVEAQVICLVNGGLFDENRYYLCMAVEKNGIERYYIIRDDREGDDTLILEGDMITVYGELFGSCKLPAELIDTRPTVPAVSMKYFDLQ